MRTWPSAGRTVGPTWRQPAALERATSRQVARRVSGLTSMPRSSGPTSSRLEGNLDLGVAARHCGSHGRTDALGMLPNTGPLGAAGQNDKRNAPPSQVLLVADTPVGREQQFEPRFLCGVEERAVVECVPTLGLCGLDRVPGQRADQPFGRAVVKEDERRRGLA